MDGLTWYFSKIKSANEERWERGLQGRLCNNFGVPGHIRLFAELIRHVERRDGLTASEMSLREIFFEVEPFLSPVTTFIATASHVQFEELFNVKLGSGGIRQYYFALSQIANKSNPDFRPTGFEQWLSEITREEQDKADKDAKWIQDFVHTYVVDSLRRVYGNGFFDKGISNKEIQISAHKRRLDDPGDSRGGPEKYLDFLDLKKIVEQKENWLHFINTLNIPLPDQKKGLSKYIQWFDEVNRIRRVSAHPYQRTYSQLDLTILQVVTKHLIGVSSGAAGPANGVNA